jgi:peptide-methionine (R)-S-oxide reductase
VSETESESETDLHRTDEEWREVLTEEEYRILREQGTEPKFSGDLLDIDEAGTFRCTGCGQVLFTSGEKYGSGTPDRGRLCAV